VPEVIRVGGLLVFRTLLVLVCWWWQVPEASSQPDQGLSCRFSPNSLYFHRFSTEECFSKVSIEGIDAALVGACAWRSPCQPTVSRAMPLR